MALVQVVVQWAVCLCDILCLHDPPTVSQCMQVTWLAGNADLTPLTVHAHNPVAGALLGVMFVFVLAMVLGNLLVRWKSGSRLHACAWCVG